MFVDQLNEISNWDYCKFDEYKEDNEILYQFGWRDGFHFYLADYQIADGLGQFFLICYKDKQQIIVKCCLTIEEAVEKVKTILNANDNH